MRKKYALVKRNLCVACGECAYQCPRSAIQIYKGSYAMVDASICIGCGICAKNCPAGSIKLEEKINDKI